MFEMLTTAQRALLFTFSAGLVTVFASMLKWVYGAVNGIDQARREAHKPAKKIE